MQKSCYKNGSCDMCGCHTTALQMANKSCDKPCYPPMMSKKDWGLFKLTRNISIKDKKYFLKIKRVTYSNRNVVKYKHTLYVDGVIKHTVYLDNSLL